MTCNHEMWDGVIVTHCSAPDCAWNICSFDPWDRARKLESHTRQKHRPATHRIRRAAIWVWHFTLVALGLTEIPVEGDRAG